MNLMEDATKDFSRVLTNPACSAHIIGFGESCIDLNLNAWIQDPEQGLVELKSKNLFEHLARIQKTSNCDSLPTKGSALNLG